MARTTKQSGFTIVELLIVIVVIGILAALVITTFTGIQKKARNTERQTDIKALHGQLEAFYAQSGYYPTLGNLNTDAWKTTNMKGLDKEATKDPKGANHDVVAAVAANGYAYVPGPVGCGAVGAECSSYTLTATLEDADPFTKVSLN